MNILLINHYAGSPVMGMEYRPWYMAREWVGAGHSVTILAASFAHVRTIQPATKKSFQEEWIDGIQYVWVKTPAYQGNGLKRILNMISFYKKIKRHAGRLAARYKPDAVIASSTYPMDNYAAAKIARISGAKYFYEVHDLWPLSPMELGGYKASHPFIKYLQKAEDFAYKNVDGVISMLPKTLQYMQGRGLDPKKWHYVPNGVMIEEWENLTSLDQEIIKKINTFRGKYKLLVGYVGGHNISNALDTVLKCARKFESSGNIGFVLVGKGSEKKRLINDYAKHNNIMFLSNVTKMQVPALLNEFDVLYVGLRKNPLYKYGTSLNKLYDYMMAGKPIIQAIDSGHNIVLEAKAGISIEAESIEALEKAIIVLSNTNNETLLKYGRNAKKYVTKFHDYHILALEFLSIIGNNDTIPPPAV